MAHNLLDGVVVVHSSEGVTTGDIPLPKPIKDGEKNDKDPFEYFKSMVPEFIEMQKVCPRVNLECCGSTGYLDFVNEGDFPSSGKSPMIWGLDPYGRPFVSLIMSRNGRRGVETFFQRYTNSTIEWTSGGPLDFVITRMNPDLWQKLRQLMASGQTEMVREYYSGKETISYSLCNV